VDDSLKTAIDVRFKRNSLRDASIYSRRREQHWRNY